MRFGLLHRSAPFLLLVTLAADCEQADPQVGQRTPAILADNDAPGEGAHPTIAKEFTTQELDRIERELKVKLPKTYRQFMLARSKELLGYIYPLRGQTEVWFDSELFGLDVDHLISENTGQRRPDMAAGDAFPGWWKEYFFAATTIHCVSTARPACGLSTATAERSSATPIRSTPTFRNR
jgi:hypothetical protein